MRPEEIRVKTVLQAVSTMDCNQDAHRSGKRKLNVVLWYMGLRVRSRTRTAIALNHECAIKTSYIIKPATSF